MSGKPIDEAVLSGRDAAFYLRWALDVLAEHGLEEFSLTIQHVHAEAERYLALTAAQQQEQAVAEDMGEFTSDTAALAFLHIIGNGNPNVERAVERLRQSLIAQSTQQGQAVALPKLKRTHPSYSREEVQWVFGYNAALSDVMRLNQNTALATQHQEPKS